MSKITKLGHSSLQQLSQSSTQSFAHRTFSPLRILMWASLFASAHSQMTDPFPATMELSSLDGIIGFVINGEAAGDHSGISVASTGDVNGDGLADLIIGAFYANPSGMSQAGKSYVVYGSRQLINGGQFNLTNINGMNGFILNGETAGDNSGYPVSSAGDVNGDNLSDMLIGANLADPSGRSSAGKSYVNFGRQNPIDKGLFNLTSLNGSNGFILNGEAPNERSGTSVSTAGDVNGDGLADILIGAVEASPQGRSNAGKIYVVFGSRAPIVGGKLELSSLNGNNGFIINGELAGDWSGYSVSSGGDVNGDGLTDILVGAFGASPSGKYRAGRSYVVYGSRNPILGGMLELSSLNGSNGFILNGDLSNDESGVSVSTAGDVNGDGFSDIVIGAYNASPSGRSFAGKSYLIYGSRNPSIGGILDLSSLNGINGFILNGEAEGDYSGRSVFTAGDVNGDGLSDFMIGAPGKAGLGKIGKSYVVYGSIEPVRGGTLELSNLNASNGFILLGEEKDDSCGFSTSTAGDVNGDGLTDLVIGAQGTTVNGKTKAGKSYVIFGRNLTMSPEIPPPLINTTASLPSLSSSVVSFPHSEITSASANLMESVTPQSSNTLTVFPKIPSSDTTPVIIGVAATVGALVCSLFGGALFFIKKRKQENYDEQGTSMVGHNVNTTENLYDQLPSGRSDGNYKDWPKESKPHTKDQYDQLNLDQLNRDRDQYQQTLAAKRHEGYDDLEQFV